ncbi:MAG: ABC1 kinase family protein [Oceanococcus sp.]
MSKDSDHKKPARGSKRFLKLAGMTASMAGRYASHRLAQGFRSDADKRNARDAFHKQSGETLATTLGELKGAAMKLGQFASQLSDFLPSELAEPLQRLQKSAPPMPFAVIKTQIESQLGENVDTLFSRLEVEPYAAASIGQVHRGQLPDGREIVVKVQYPGVAESCDSDLRQLRRVLQAGRLIQVDKHVLKEIFEEIRARLKEELDYCQEAYNLRHCAELHKNDHGIIIPRVIDSHSRSQVLTMEYQAGKPLSEASEDTALASQLGLKLFHFLSRGLFEFGHIHADPNPGNFAFDEAGRLIVYDFGCVKNVPEHIVNAYRAGVIAGLKEDWMSLDHALMTLGARVPGSPRMPDEFYAQWRPIALKPFLQQGPFDFGLSRVHKAVMAKSPEVLQYTDRLQPAAQTLFVDRVISGHYWNLVEMQAQVDVGRALQRYL